MKNRKLISVVIISRNEESTIDKCIRSIMYELKNYHFEIILVDSASTDNTIKIAKKYPIKIIQLNQNKYLSPSAGRYIGTKESTGEFIFFMDSDAIIIGGFVKKALKYFKKNVAGVRGVLYRVYPGEILNKKHKERVRFGNHDPLWGQAAIYRKSALDLCGTFNPFVRGEEERELEQRLRSKEFKLLIIDIPMCYHIEKHKNIEEIDEKAGYFTGVGQIMRKYLFKKAFWIMITSHQKIYRQVSYFIIPAVLIITTLILKEWFFSVIIFSIMLSIVFTGIAVKGYKKIYLFVRSRTLIVLNIIKGFNMGIKNAKKFDKLVKIKRIK